MKSLTTLKNFLLLLGGTVALTACPKDKDDTPGLSRTDLLTAQNWRVTAVTTTTTTNGTVSVEDDYLTYRPCERDDFMKFSPDGTAVEDAGATKCNSVDSQTESLTWALSQDQQQLLLGSSASPTVGLTIVELSATTLHLRTSQALSGSISETGDLIYTAF